MSAIFISHASVNNDAAEDIKNWLEIQQHTSIFLDLDRKDGLISGEKWEQAIYHHLRRARGVILLFSESSKKSSWCFAEITQARSFGCRIFPVLIEPTPLSGDLWELIKDHQLTDLTQNRKVGLEQLWQGMIAAGLDPGRIRVLDTDRPLYRGLAAFEEKDAAIFFGRDGDVDVGLKALDKLRSHDGPRLALILSASGSGKSSLMSMSSISEVNFRIFNHHN